MSKVRSTYDGFCNRFQQHFFTKPKQERPDHHSRDDHFRWASGSCVTHASCVDGNNLVTVPRLALLASSEAFFVMSVCLQCERPSAANPKAITLHDTVASSSIHSRATDGCFNVHLMILDH